VLVSTTDDETIDKFVACMMDGATACNNAFACASILPINF